MLTECSHNDMTDVNNYHGETDGISRQITGDTKKTCLCWYARNTLILRHIAFSSISLTFTKLQFKKILEILNSHFFYMFFFRC